MKKTNTSRKVVSILLALSLAFSTFANDGAFAAAAENKGKNLIKKYNAGEYIAPLFDTTVSLRKGKKDKKVSKFATEVYAVAYPRSFSLFKGGEATSVDEITPTLKDQANWGCCWAFSSTGSAESSLYKNGSPDVDFAERHLAYFTYHGSNNPNAPEDGTNGDSYLHADPFEGGGFYQAISTLARGAGAEYESTVPYPTWNDFHTNITPFNTVDEKYHFDSHYQLREADFLPDQDASGKLDGSAIKNALQGGTSVAMMYAAGTAGDPAEYIKQDGIPYPTYYNSKPYKADHGVQIVGWNDDIPASAFTDPSNGNAHPSHNGGWLIKNTWGTAYANCGGTYFYISYEDQSLQQFCEFLMDDRKDSPRYAHNYQYDGIGQDNVWGNPNKPASMANVFTATGNQNLDAVAFYTTDVDAKYKIHIYKGVTSKSAPFNDTKVVAEETGGTETFVGYHTVDLGSPVKLSKGEKFSVVIDLENPNHHAAPIPIEQNSPGQAKVSIGAGQSYVNGGPGWGDLAANRQGVGNVCIKAFTNDQKVNPLAKITVSPSSATVVKGGSQQFSAAVTNMSLSDVIWTVSGNTSSSTSVDSTGKLTVDASEGASTLTVKAANMADPSICSTATVTVAPKPSISVTPSTATVVRGSNQQFTAAVTNMSLSDVIWSVSGNKSSSTVIDSTGRLTVDASEGGSPLTVKAANKTDPTVFSTASVTVAARSSITVTPSTASVAKGGSKQFSAAVIGMSPSDVVWSVSGNTSSSTIIDGSGKLTVDASESGSPLTVKATNRLDPSVFSTAIVTVLPRPSITITPSTANVLIGGSQQFSATVTGMSLSDVAWTVSGNKSPSTVVDGTGKLTIAANETASALTVKATDKTDSGVNSSAAVTVISKPSVTVTPSTAAIAKGHSLQFSAAVVGFNPSDILWSVSGNVSSATTIDRTGKLIVAANETASTLTVKAVNKANQAVYSTAAVTVVSKTGGITVTPSTAALARGHNLQFTALMAGLNSSDILWSVLGNNSPSTSVDNTGMLTVAANETAPSVTVKAEDKADSNNHFYVTVTLASKQNVNISPFNSTLSKGQNLQFHAVVTGINTNDVFWTVSGNTSSATMIDQTGRLMVGPDETALALTVQAASTWDSSAYGTAHVTVNSTSAILDTGHTLDVVQGNTYKFMVTDSHMPTFVSGNDNGFQVAYSGSEGNHYYFTTTAVGAVGMSVGFYVDGENTPRCIGTITQPKFTSASIDTSGTLNVEQGKTYQFMITDSHMPTFVSGNGNGFDVTYSGSEGNHYYFKATAVGSTGMCVGFYVNGEKSPRCVGMITQPKTTSAVLDTGSTLTLEHGRTYQFMVTDSHKPTFASGNENGFRVTYSGSQGNHYFYKVTAVGATGMCVGFYVNGERLPRCVGTIG